MNIMGPHLELWSTSESVVTLVKGNSGFGEFWPWKSELGISAQRNGGTEKWRTAICIVAAA